MDEAQARAEELQQVVYALLITTDIKNEFAVEKETFVVCLMICHPRSIKNKIFCAKLCIVAVHYSIPATTARSFNSIFHAFWRIFHYRS